MLDEVGVILGIHCVEDRRILRLVHEHQDVLRLTRSKVEDDIDGDVERVAGRGADYRHGRDFSTSFANLTCILYRRAVFLQYIHGGDVKETPGRIPLEDRPDFRSYAKATWRDLNNRVHQRYSIQAMKDGSGGYEIIDTFNDANAVVSAHFVSVQAATEWMNKNIAP